MQDININDELKNAGIDLNSNRATYFLTDGFDKLENKSESFVFIPIKEAVKKYPEVLEKYFWKIVDKDKDEITKKVYENFEGGYFIWIKEGHKEFLPLQACFYIKTSLYEQKVHNLIILEDNSELHIINGCVSSSSSNQNSHYGITEIYVGKNATLSYTMIHTWNETTEVRPRTGVNVDKGGKYISNYIAFKKTKIVQSYPTVYLSENAFTSINSIIYARDNSVYDLGGRAILLGNNARAEINSRSVSEGGTIIARADISAEADNTFGHIECSSIMLSDKGNVHTIPELRTNKKNVTLSHEAMIGKIAEEEIYYLMSRGLTEKEAISLIVKGFLNIKIEGLPDVINKNIEEVVNILVTESAL